MESDTSRFISGDYAPDGLGIDRGPKGPNVLYRILSAAPLFPALLPLRLNGIPPGRVYRADQRSDPGIKYRCRGALILLAGIL
jgi:hypothetical protein